MEDFLGKNKIPIEETSLDGPKHELDFRAKEYFGVEAEIRGEDGFAVAADKDDVKPGAVIYVIGLFGGRHELTVDDVMEDGETWAAYTDVQNKAGMGAFLKWAPDDRECWVAQCLFNATALERMQINFEAADG